VKKKTAARPGLVRLWAKPRPRWRLLSIRNFAFELSHAPFELFNRTIKLLPLSPRTSELLLSRARRPYIAAFCRLVARFAPCEFLCERQHSLILCGLTGLAPAGASS
jgi:hypothetical protein